MDSNPTTVAAPGGGTVSKAVVEGQGVKLVADVAGPVEGRPVVLLHGGGQTRASWGRAILALGAAGRRAYSFDLRGHGDSDWAPDGDYRLDRYVDDLQAITRTLSAPPVLVGASLGGLASLLAAGERSVAAAGLVLVDVTPRLEPAGARKIGAFMTGNPEGFASLEEASAAVAAYLPHRAVPTDPSGLMRNLRLRDDGRLHWHWDPRMMSGDLRPNPGDQADRLDAAARALDIPTLLVRGRLSQVVSEESVKHFRALAPKAEFVDVADADHMVAGDANDAFNGVILDFIDRVA